MLNDITLGQYFPGDSAIHRMDPRMKLILTILYIVGVFCVGNLPGYAIALLFLYIVVRISGIKFSYLAQGHQAPSVHHHLYVCFEPVLCAGGDAAVYARLFHPDAGSPA